jgi:hypothetical protein
LQLWHLNPQSSSLFTIDNFWRYRGLNPGPLPYHVFDAFTVNKHWFMQRLSHMTYSRHMWRFYICAIWSFKASPLPSLDKSHLKERERVECAQTLQLNCIVSLGASVGFTLVFD